MAVCADCDNEYESDWKAKGLITGFCSKCKDKKKAFWSNAYGSSKTYINNLAEKPVILTPVQEAQVSRLVNTYGMEREDAITSLRKFWERSN